MQLQPLQCTRTIQCQLQPKILHIVLLSFNSLFYCTGCHSDYYPFWQGLL